MRIFMKEYQSNTALYLAIRAVFLGMPLLVSSLTTTSIYAASEQNFAISKNSLNIVLKEFAIQTGITISYDAENLAKLKSNGIKGSYSVNQALEKLLQPHQLEFIRLDTGGYAIQKQKNQPISPKIVSLQPIHAQADATTKKNNSNITTPNETILPTISMTASNDKQQAQIGKTPQDLKEIPQSVTVVSRERMDQQGLKTLDDVMLQTTGVTREQLWLNNNYSSRGLKIENIRYDGGGTSTLQDRNNNADMAQYESVALLRGADGLFGAGEAGGVISLTSKRPKAETELKGTLSAGSWNNYRNEIDGTGSLNQDQTIQGRAVAVFPDQDFFYKPTHNRREMLYGALSFQFTPQTTLFTGASYQKDKTDAFNASLPRWQDGADLELPRSTTMGAPWGWMKRENIALFANFQHEINDYWKAQFNVRHNIGNDGINTAEMEGAVNYETLESQWWRNQSKTDFKETTLDLNLQGSFNLFNQKHDVILGIDQVNNKKDYKENWIYYADGNAFNRVPPPEWDYPAQPWDKNTTDKKNMTATYGSLRFRPIEQLAVIVGGRYTFNDETTLAKNKLDNNVYTTTKNKYNEENKFVPYYGITYDILPSTTLYTSFAEIYKSQRNYLKNEADTVGLMPLTGRNIEFGIKHELTSNLLASIAYFDIQKKNEKVYQSRGTLGNSNSSCCYVASGSMQSKGIDLELNGQITPEWEVALGYTYNKNENKENLDRPYDTYTPKHLVKIWTNYKLDQWLEGLEIGGGVTAQSKNYATGYKQEFNPITNKFDGAWVSVDILQPHYTLWSLRAAYEINSKLNLALNLNNILDKKYYSTIGLPGYGNFYGEPRSLLLTLKAKY